MSAVVDRAFDYRFLPAINADVDPRNASALKLLARLGAKETGRIESTWQVADGWYDSVDLRFTTEDWNGG